MTLRLTAEQDRALSLLAQAQGSSKQEAAVRAIVSTAARTLSDNQVRDIATDILDEYLEMQKRLDRGKSWWKLIRSLSVAYLPNKYF